MKESKLADIASLKLSRDSNVNGNDSSEDNEPYRRPPTPTWCHARDMWCSLQAEPLLALTPEKSMALTYQTHKLSCAGDTVKSDTRGEDSVRSDRDGENAVFKGKPKVRFAPGTRNSPERAIDKKEDCQDESLPRSCSTISQKLYQFQPALYTDDAEINTFRQPAGREAAAAAIQGSNYTRKKDKYVPMHQSVSKYCDSQIQKSVTARVIQHKPVNPKTLDYFKSEILDTEIVQLLKSSPPTSKSSIVMSAHKSDILPGCYQQPLSPPDSPNNSRSSTATSHKSLTATSPKRRQLPMDRSHLLKANLEGHVEAAVQVVKEAAEIPVLSDYSFPFHADKQNGQELESALQHPLARPEFNSALKISEEMKNAKARKPDTWAAVSQQLKECDRKRMEIQEKASAKVNVHQQWELYAGLVDVDVPFDDLCEDVEKQITQRVPPATAPSARIDITQEPDLMEFFPPDLQRELPDLTLSGIQPIANNLSVANSSLAFDLYRHNCAWEGQSES